MGSERLPQPTPSPEDLQIQQASVARGAEIEQAQRAAILKREDDKQAEALVQRIEHHRAQKLVEAYRDTTLKSDAADYTLSEQGAKDIAEYYHTPRVFRLNYPEQKKFESEESFAGALDLPTYFQGGRHALYDNLVENQANSLGIELDELSEADKENAAHNANYLANLIKLRQEGHEGVELPEHEEYMTIGTLKPEDIETFQEGAAQALGGGVVGARKAKDITAALEGRIKQISPGVGAELLAFIQYERMDRINDAKNIRSNKNHVMDTSHFRSPAFVAEEDATGRYVRSRHGRVIDPAMETHAVHKPGQPSEYQTRMVNQMSEAIKGDIKETAKEAKEIFSEVVMERSIIKGAIKRLKARRKPEAERRKL